MTPLIDSSEALTELCEKLATARTVAVDTEFIRERTYYPRLCLVQVATRSELACVDTLALDDLEPLLAILQTATITKVLHAARQDLEVLSLAAAPVPSPVFDTQIAADLCGLGNQTGLAALANTLLDVELDKGHARADWSARPLSDTLLEYAADDVRYLVAIAELLEARLAELGRLEWLREDCERLCDPALYVTAPEQAWRRVNGSGRLQGRAFHALRRLAAWRERRAMAMDRPRGWVVRDEVLIDLALSDADNAAALAEVRGLPRAIRRSCTDELLAIMTEARADSGPTPQQKEPLTPEQKALAKRLMTELRGVAEGLDISASTLATRRDVTTLVRGQTDTPVLSGWRRAVIGERLLELSADA